MERLTIRHRHIDSSHPLFVVAEIGLNHDGDVQRALQLVDEVAAAGANAVKLQTLRADLLVSKQCPAPAHVPAGSLVDRLRRFELTEAQQALVAERAHARGLAFISTPLYDEAVDLLERLDVDAFKIASGDLTNHRLIARAARTGRPVILSTGMSEAGEIAAAIACCRDAGGGPVALLHCVSAYPTPHDQQNLRAVRTLRETFQVEAGLSDHASDPESIALAVALGASVYERHVMRADDGEAIDRAVSSTPDELGVRIRAAQHAREALGDGRRTCAEAERANRRPSRRSLFAATAIRTGDLITESMIVALRPGDGLDARRWRDLIGKVAARDLVAGDPFLEADCRSCSEGVRRAAV